MRNQLTQAQSDWLDALSSGLYKQQRDGMLHQIVHGHDEFCCLGVACHISDIKQKIMGEDGESSRVVRYAGEDEFAPDHIIEKLELYSSRGRFRYINESEIQACHWAEAVQFTVYDYVDNLESLVDINDNTKRDFKDIAAFIRKYPWLVFKNFDLPDNLDPKEVIRI